MENCKQVERSLFGSTTMAPARGKRKTGGKGAGTKRKRGRGGAAIIPAALRGRKSPRRKKASEVASSEEEKEVDTEVLGSRTSKSNRASKQRKESELIRRSSDIEEDSGEEEGIDDEKDDSSIGNSEEEEEDITDATEARIAVSGKTAKRRKVIREGGGIAKSRRSMSRVTSTPTSSGVEDEDEDSSSDGMESEAMADKDDFVSLKEGVVEGKDGKIPQGQRDVLKGLVKKNLFPRVKYIKSAQELGVNGGIAKIVFKELGKTDASMEDKLRWWTEERKNIIRIELGFKRNNVSSVMKQKFFGKNVSLVGGC